MAQLCQGLLLLLLFACPVCDVQGQKFRVDTLQYSGNSASFINLVILGDGYTASQQGKYRHDAREFSQYLFSAPPFDAYNQYFNVFAIQVVSAESGVKHPGTATDCYTSFVPVSNPDNYFGTTFDVGGIHRLVVPVYSQRIASVLAENLPDYDQVVLLANTPYYGGSGGQYATTTLHKSSNEIALHELGHSFAGLADEYWAGEIYAREKPNMTRESQPALVKWKNWLSPGTGIGIYPYSQPDWFKPGQGTCKMEFLSRPLCAVCSEAIVEQIHHLVSPLGDLPGQEPEPLHTNPHTPDFYLGLTTIKPHPNTLKTSWQLNGVPVAANKDSVLIVPAKLPEGSNKLLVSVQDTTLKIRTELHLSHRYVRTWTIEHSHALPVELKDFKAWGHPGGVSLRWATATEVNNLGFAVERSPDGRDWQEAGWVPGRGNSQALHHYSFEDAGPFSFLPATLYYRLKQVDLQGQVHYSPMQAITLEQERPQLRLVGNPVTRQLQFESLGLAPGPLHLEIYKPDGSHVLQLPLSAPGRVILVPVTGLAQGVYVYSFYQDGNLVVSGKFLKSTE